MADSFKAKQITSLTENTSIADTDIVPVGNAGTSTLRRIKWANILAAIKSKITSWTYSFNTSSKTLEGAVNEMQGNISAINGSLNNKVDISNEIFKNNGYVSDADQCSRTGIYWTSDNSAHVNGYGVLLVFESAPGAEFSANNWITQMFLYNYENNIKIRKKIGTDNWTAWQTIG